MNSPLAIMVLMSLTAVGIFCAMPTFWYLPSTFLKGKAAAAGIALINALCAISGFIAPCVTGWTIDLTGNPNLGMWLAGVLEVAAFVTILALARRLKASDAVIRAADDRVSREAEAQELREVQAGPASS